MSLIEKNITKDKFLLNPTIKINIDNKIVFGYLSILIVLSFINDYLAHIVELLYVVLILNSVLVIIVPYILGDTILHNSNSFILKYFSGLLIILLIYICSSTINNFLYYPIYIKYVIILVSFIFLFIRMLLKYKVLLQINFSPLSFITFIIFLVPFFMYRIYSQHLYYGLNVDTPAELLRAVELVDRYGYLPFDVRIGGAIFIILGTLTVNVTTLTIDQIFLSLIFIQIIFIFIFSYGILKLSISYVTNIMNVDISNISLQALIISLIIPAIAFQGCLDPTKCLNFDVLQYSLRGNTILISLFPWILYDYIIYRQKISTKSMFTMGAIFISIWIIRILPIAKFIGYIPTSELLYRDYPLYSLLTVLSFILLHKNRGVLSKIFMIYTIYLATHAEETIFYILTYLIISSEFSNNILRKNNFIYLIFHKIGYIIPILLIIRLTGYDFTPPWYPPPFTASSAILTNLASSDIFSNLLVIFLILYLYFCLRSSSNSEKEKIWELLIFPSLILLFIYLLPIFYFYRIFKIFMMLTPLYSITYIYSTKMKNFYKYLLLIAFILGSSILLVERALYTYPLYFSSGQFLLSPVEISTMDHLVGLLHRYNSEAYIFLSDYFSMYSFTPLIGGILPIGRYMTIQEQQEYGNLTMLIYIYNSLLYNNVTKINLDIHDFPFAEQFFIRFLCKNKYNFYLIVWQSYRTNKALFYYKNFRYLGFVWDVYPWKNSTISISIFKYPYLCR